MILRMFFILLVWWFYPQTSNHIFLLPCLTFTLYVSIFLFIGTIFRSFITSNYSLPLHSKVKILISLPLHPSLSLSFSRFLYATLDAASRKTHDIFPRRKRLLRPQPAREFMYVSSSRVDAWLFRKFRRAVIHSLQPLKACEQSSRARVPVDVYFIRELSCNLVCAVRVNLSVQKRDRWLSAI